VFIWTLSCNNYNLSHCYSIAYDTLYNYLRISVCVSVRVWIDGGWVNRLLFTSSAQRGSIKPLGPYFLCCARLCLLLFSCCLFFGEIKIYIFGHKYSFFRMYVCMTLYVIKMHETLHFFARKFKQFSLPRPHPSGRQSATLGLWLDRSRHQRCQVTCRSRSDADIRLSFNTQKSVAVSEWVVS